MNKYNANDDTSTTCIPCTSPQSTGGLNAQASCNGKSDFNSLKSKWIFHVLVSLNLLWWICTLSINDFYKFFINNNKVTIVWNNQPTWAYTSQKKSVSHYWKPFFQSAWSVMQWQLKIDEQSSVMESATKKKEKITKRWFLLVGSRIIAGYQGPIGKLPEILAPCQ